MSIIRNVDALVYVRGMGVGGHVRKGGAPFEPQVWRHDSPSWASCMSPGEPPKGKNGHVVYVAHTLRPGEVGLPLATLVATYPPPAWTPPA